MEKNDALSIFDFDKTLIRGDSFRIFSLLASENLWKKVLVLVLALGGKAGWINNQRYKEYVLRIVWLEKNEKTRAKILQKLYHRLQQLERPEIVNLLRIHLQKGDRIVAISASPLFYLRPYLQSWSEDIKVFGSELQVVNGKIKFDNLYGLRKELCVRSIIEQEKPSEVWIYTDHISDLPIIKLADHVRLVRPSAKLRGKLRQLSIKYEIVSS